MVTEMAGKREERRAEESKMDADQVKPVLLSWMLSGQKKTFVDYSVRAML